MALEFGLDCCLWVGIIDGLMDSNKREKVILEDAKIEEKSIAMPGESADGSASNSVEDEMVSRGDNGSQYQGRIRQAKDNNDNTLPRGGAEPVDGEGRNSEADEEGVSKVKRGHSSC